MKHSKSSGRSKKRSAASAGDSRSRRSSRYQAPGPVLGLDLSLTGTGLVVLRPDGKILRRRRYKTEPLKDGDGLKPRPRGQLAPDRFVGTDEERIEWHRQRVTRAVKKFGICFCVIEGYAFKAKGRGKTGLSEQAGVIKNALHRMDVAFVIIQPGTLKKHVTGHGDASKQDVIDWAKKNKDRRISDSDTADACAAAQYGVDLYEKLVDE